MFGIGAGEFILIFIILLVVVGPERLPTLARQGGQMLVRARNWVQQSPDAAMVLRARQEIENELSQLRLSLAEVQNVRDQVVEAAKQVQQSVHDDVIAPTQQIGRVLKDEVSGTRQQVAEALNGTLTSDGAAEAAAATSSDAASIAATAADTATDAADIAVEAAQQALEAAHTLQEAAAAQEASALPPINPVALDEAGATLLNGQTVVRARSREELMRPAHNATTNGALAAQAPPDTIAFEQLQRQLATLVADLGALQAELRQRGLIGDGAPSAPAADEQPVGAIEGGHFGNE